MGNGLGPSPVQMLAAAVGNCLADSFLFALRKFKQSPEPLRCEVQAEVGRNAEGRLRVLKIKARLTLGAPAAGLEHLDRMSKKTIFLDANMLIRAVLGKRVRERMF